MCPNDNAPLLPNRCDSLYDSEAGSDVIFLVGPDQERVPGHREVLARANPVFRVMLQGPLSTPLPIHIEDVDGRAFDQLKRFLYKEQVQIQSVPTALSTLYAAHKYLCHGLVEQCVSYLDATLAVTNVLEVYNTTRVFTRAPSAPPLDDVHPPPPTCDALLHNALQYIDTHADAVLGQEYVEDLDLEALKCILVRDTLRVSSELVVFSVVNRWCNRECKRRQMELTPEMRRTVLGEDTLFLVRYLLMTSEEFLMGPMQTDLLDHNDAAIIIGHILRVNLEVSKKLEDILPSMRRPRTGADVGVVPLSGRTTQVGEGDKKKKKKKRKSSRSPSRDEGRERRGAGTKLLECLVGVVSCVFD